MLNRFYLVILGLALGLSLMACGSNNAGNLPGPGGENVTVNPGEETVIGLHGGSSVIFPAGAVATAATFTITETLSAEMLAAAGFPPNSGDLLGGVRITAPAGVQLLTNITVNIAIAPAQTMGTTFIVYRFDEGQTMWESTEAAASAVRNVSAIGDVNSSGRVVGFVAPTANTTGLDSGFGVFADLQGNPIGENTIPTVDLTANATSVLVGATVNLTATGADADSDTLTFSWLAAGGTLGTPATTGGTSTCTWSAAAAGVYTISASCSDGNGGVAVDSVEVTVNAAPVPNDAPAFDNVVAGDVAAPVAGQKIRLSALATDPEGGAVTYDWSGGGTYATPTADATAGAKVFWTPTGEGSMTATCTASDPEGNETTSTLTVTVAAYPQAAAFGFVGYATCLGCHNDKGDATAGTGWFTTRHHDAIQRQLSDPTNTHAFRNPACYACHALGWEPNDSGQGYIDWDLTPGLGNIQCESCHGGGNPAGMGAGHKTSNWNPLTGMKFDTVNNTWIPDPDFDSSHGVGCGACHEGSRHGAVEEWAKSGHGSFVNTEDDGSGNQVPAHQLTGASCAKCHNGQQFVNVQIKGNAAADVTLTLDDLPNVYISCASCHDPHNATNEMQLRVSNTEDVIIPWDDTPVNGGWGNICLKCHNGRRTRTDYDGQVTNGNAHFGPHGNPQGALFFGLMGADLGGATTYATDHPHRTWNADTCVTCHMYRRPYIDAANPVEFGHEFAPRIERCITCHTNYTIDDADAFWAWVADFQTNEIQARLDAFVAAWPAAWKSGTDLVNVESAVGAGDGPPADDPVGNGYREALWNYDLVLNDATKGVHNPTFTKDLLDKSIARLEELNALP